MRNFFSVLMLFISTTVFCQLGGMSISPTGTAPDPSAGLDVNFSNKGMLIPRLSQTQRDSISNPAFGLLILNNTTNCVEMYGFGYWQSISCLCSGPPSTPSSITGNNNPCSGSSNEIYSVGLVSGAGSYTWSVPSGAAIIAGQGTNSVTVNFGVTPGNVSVTANNNCGTSNASVFPVTINTIPAAPVAIMGSDTVCANSVGNIYKVNPVAGATTYNWLLPSGTVTNGQGTDSITVSFGATSGNMSVTSGNVCGNSIATILQMDILNNHGSQQFYFTGNQQVFVVPGCISTLSITAYGAQGGTGSDGPGGYGGLATGNLAVNPGDTLYIYVGSQAGGTSGGYNGGGNGVGGGTSQSAGTGSSGTCTIGGAAGSTNGGWSGGGGGGGLTSGGVGTANAYSNTAGTGTQGVGGDYGSNNSCGCCGSAACGGGYYGGGGTSTGQCASGCGGGGC